MNQSDYFRRRKIFNPSKNHRYIPAISIGIGILAIVFFLSFYISYSKISSSKDLSKNINITLGEKDNEIAELQGLINKKDEQIMELKEQILKYEQKYGLVSGANGINSTNVESGASSNNSSGNTSGAGTATNKSSGYSKVQKDVYRSIKR